MDGFKKIIKMKCGGSVSKAVEKCSGGRMKTGGKVSHDDTKEDKKLIKKAFSIHDEQSHEEKTDLSTLKKGGRCKKTGGTVRKYAAGGEVEAKGKRPKPINPEPDDCPRSPTFKKGGKIKKLADGGMAGPLAAANQAAGAQANPVQNAVAAQLLKRKLAQQAAAAQAAGAAGGMGGPAAAAPAAPVGQPTPQNIGATTGPIMKKGGKVKGKK